jgi:hypothetical protein
MNLIRKTIPAPKHEVWFSYEEMVAFAFPDDDYPTVIQNQWSNTTAGHLNKIDRGSKAAIAARLEPEDFYDEYKKKVREAP